MKGTLTKVHAVDCAEPECQAEDVFSAGWTRQQATESLLERGWTDESGRWRCPEHAGEADE